MRIRRAAAAEPDSFAYAFVIDALKREEDPPREAAAVASLKHPLTCRQYFAQIVAETRRLAIAPGPRPTRSARMAVSKSTLLDSFTTRTTSGLVPRSRFGRVAAGERLDPLPDSESGANAAPTRSASSPLTQTVAFR